MVNLRLKKYVLEVLENQLKADNPEEVSNTLNRLIELGHEEKIAKEKIAAVLLVEIYDVLKTNTPYNEKRYIQNLKNLK